MTHNTLSPVVELFQVDSKAIRVEPFGSGHINDTYRVIHADGSETILQRLNPHVFPEPHKVMENMDRVCRHLAEKVEDPARGTLRVISARDGRSYHHDGSHVWRLVHLVHDVRSYDQVESCSQAFEVGQAFGAFQAALADLPAPRLHETIVDFHHTPRRYARLMHVAEADPHGRRDGARAELEAARRFGDQVERLVRAQYEGRIPERVTHNDTKLNNLLFDSCGRAQCVVDLDTVMPGLVHYDFGDMVRTATCRAREDEADLTQVHVDPELFRSLVGGYLRGARTLLTPEERHLLAFSGLLITYEVAIRFLTDHLEGDVYFKNTTAGHNLRRARNQLALFHSLEQRLDWMERTVEQTWSEI